MTKQDLEALDEIQGLLGIAYTGPVDNEEEIKKFIDKWIPQVYDACDAFAKGFKEDE